MIQRLFIRRKFDLAADCRNDTRVTCGPDTMCQDSCSTRIARNRIPVGTVNFTKLIYRRMRHCHSCRTLWRGRAFRNYFPLSSNKH